jgi:uncharacterized protein YdhG (YjbR/CyaY superfamily)
MKKPKDVGAYIEAAPRETRLKLIRLRKIIKASAPNAKESISYGMPSFDKGRVAWFGLMKNHIGLYLRPPIIQEHQKELEGYPTTKSAVHLPLDKKLPDALIRKLIKARVKKNEKTHNRRVG